MVLAQTEYINIPHDDHLIMVFGENCIIEDDCSPFCMSKKQYINTLYAHHLVAPRSPWSSREGPWRIGLVCVGGPLDPGPPRCIRAGCGQRRRVLRFVEPSLLRILAAAIQWTWLRNIRKVRHVVLKLSYLASQGRLGQWGRKRRDERRIPRALRETGWKALCECGGRV
jgi:hypothetical protein